ncbi:Putative uncharacterized protein [Propionibacterium freudenreichii]|nr:Putative uncharacterized protein [Propionibacterium freudenreichii]CEH11005.1 Putative uncharacterized protein [Propionibacterium freudenreichii]CEI22283.1 Putative uncharacterized protein [Propionibacterium freudenreichii]SBN49961.1 Substrate-specific component CbrT of predicted cobalamin ECF transporter [Propionibacterium freudenreichii]SBW75930.1 Substrate-specific component CbrT of predicted cobalamin ECF transporter [Propionibacterium freudenreichii]
MTTTASASKGDASMSRTRLPSTRTVGAMSGWSSRAMTASMVVIGLAWLLWPLADSLSAPSRRQVNDEAPWVLAAALAMAGALGVTMWLDSGRSTRVMGVLGSMVVANCLVRALITPRLMGVEPVYVLPLLAGIAFGGPAGMLVGVWSCAASAVLIASVSTALPAQMVIWGCVGLAGALFARMRHVFAWLGGIALGFVAGPAAGLFLNLIGWPTDTAPGDVGFLIGLGPAQNGLRLLRYTAQTSLAYDCVRGFTTALGMALVGLPLIIALRRVWGVSRPSASAGLQRLPIRRVTRSALRRRRRAEHVDELWHPQPPSVRAELCGAVGAAPSESLSSSAEPPRRLRLSHNTATPIPSNSPPVNPVTQEG